MGKLFQDIDADVINAKLHIENINKTGSMIVKCVKNNAKEYCADIDYRKLVDSILEKQAQEID